MKKSRGGEAVGKKKDEVKELAGGGRRKKTRLDLNGKKTSFRFFPLSFSPPRLMVYYTLENTKKA